MHLPFPAGFALSDNIRLPYFLSFSAGLLKSKHYSFLFHVSYLPPLVTAPTAVSFRLLLWLLFNSPRATYTNNGCTCRKLNFR